MKFFKSLTKPPVAPVPKDERKTGRWFHPDIERLCEMVSDLPGDYAEIGVFRGAAFVKVVEMAVSQSKMAHAFDSFTGMNDPATFDGVGYPKGKFDIGGPDAFVEIMEGCGVARESYRVHGGYIPECFDEVEESLQFSFAILDVDHYEPSVTALEWLWPRMVPGGILALDDFVPHFTGLATRASKEFLRSKSDYNLVDFFNQQLILQKI
jgi:O-methyltransferase